MFWNKNKDIHKEYCACGTTENLVVYSKRTNAEGGTTFYYNCRPCAAKRKNDYYHNGNQQRYKDANKRYLKKKALTNK